MNPFDGTARTDGLLVSSAARTVIGNRVERKNITPIDPRENRLIIVFSPKNVAKALPKMLPSPKRLWAALRGGCGYFVAGVY